jgi:hypothetical protein
MVYDSAAGVWKNTLTLNGLLNVESGQAQFGDDTNFTDFAADGSLTLHGTARVNKHIKIAMAGVKRGATAPTEAVIGNYNVLQFAGGGTTDEVYTTFHVPEDWDNSTDIKVHVHWAPVNANAGSVVWQMNYVSLASNAGELISAGGTGLTVTDPTNSTQDELLESPDMIIVKENIAAEDMLGIRLFRDPNDGDDTYGSAASMVWIEFEYTANKLGVPV